MSSFTKQLPKSELHAHLNGSISAQTLLTLLEKKLLLEPENEVFLKHLNDQSWIPTLPSLDLFQSLDLQRTHLDDIFKHFDVINAVVTTLEDLAVITTSVLEDFFKDGVYYLELRTTPKQLNGASFDAYITTVVSCLKTAESTFQSPPGYPRFCPRLILSINRNKHDVHTAWEIIKLAEKWREKTSQKNDDYYLPGGAVVGIDVCGNPISDQLGLTRFLPHFEYCKTKHLGVTIHFAEK